LLIKLPKPSFPLAYGLETGLTPREAFNAFVTAIVKTPV
jgi:hypothetical protein